MITTEYTIWGSLQQFWGEERVDDKWQAELKHGDYTNTKQIRNMTTLAPEVHAYWGRAMCAFRPVFINEDDDDLPMKILFLCGSMVDHEQRGAC